MIKNRYLITEEFALDRADAFYEELPLVEKGRHDLPLRLLQLENHYFREAMILQIAGFVLIVRDQPFKDKGTQAALALAISGFDHLRRGWLCNFEGYYLVGQTILRRIFEGTLYEMAVVFDQDIAADWWQNKLGLGTVTKKVIPKIESIFNKQEAGAGTTLAECYKFTWKALNKLTHSNWSAIGTSVVSIPSQKDNTAQIYTFGGYIWNPKLCKGLGRLYARSAIEATVAMGIAFAPQLIDAKKWKKRQRPLITEGLSKDLRDSRSL